MPQTLGVPAERKRLPHPALVFVVLAWGLNFSVIKFAYQDMKPEAVGLLRYLLMAPLLALWCVLAGQSLKYPKGSFWKLNLAGFIGSGAYMVLFLEGLRTAPAALAAIALSTAPLITTFLSVVFKQEKFTWTLLAGSVVAFSGVAVGILGVGSKSAGDAHGALLVLASAVLWSISILAYRNLLKEYSPVRTLTLSFPGALAVLLPYGWTAMVATDWSKVSSKGWASMAYLVLVAGVGAFAAYYKGLADVGPARTSMTQYFVPPIAALFAAIVIPEKLELAEIVSLFIVIGGVILATWRRPVEPAKES